MKSLKKNLAMATSTALLSSLLMVPAFSAQAAAPAALTVAPGLATLELSITTVASEFYDVTVNGAADTGATVAIAAATTDAAIASYVKGKIATLTTVGYNAVKSAGVIKFDEADIAVLAGKKIVIKSAATALDEGAEAAATTTIDVAKRADAVGTPQIDYVKGTIKFSNMTGVKYKVGADAAALDTIGEFGSPTDWPADFVVPDAVATSADDDTIGFRRIEADKYPSAVVTEAVTRIAAPAAATLTLDAAATSIVNYAEEKLITPSTFATGLEFKVEDTEAWKLLAGSPVYPTAKEIKAGKVTVGGKVLKVRVKGDTANTKFPSLAYTTPKIAERATTPTVAAVKDGAIDFANETLIMKADTPAFQYRYKSSEKWTDVSPTDAEKPVSLATVLEKGVKGAEFRTKGSATAGGEATPKFASEPVKVDLIRPNAPKKDAYALKYTGETSGSDIVGAVSLPEGVTAPIQIGLTTDGKKLKTDFPYQDVTASTGTTGILDLKTGTATATGVYTNSSYLVRFPATAAAFASKTMVLKTPKIANAAKYEYLPLAEVIKGVKSGTTSYWVETGTVIDGKIDAGDAPTWTKFTFADGKTFKFPDAMAPDASTGADRYVFLRTEATDKKPASAISTAVKILKKAATPTVNETGTVNILVNMTDEKVTFDKGGTYAFRKVSDGTKVEKWKVVGKTGGAVSLKLSSFMPKSGDPVKYEFITAGAAKAAATNTVSNSTPIVIEFQARKDATVAEDIVYNYATMEYTAAAGKTLLVSADGKTNWTTLTDAGTFKMPTADAAKPVMFKVKYADGVAADTGWKTGLATSAKALKYSFAKPDAGPSVDVATDGAITANALLEQNSDGKPTTACSALPAKMTDGTTIHVRTKATATAPASKFVKVSYKAQKADPATPTA